MVMAGSAMGANALERIARGAILSGSGGLIVVILDGASEPIGEAPTSLERARMPALDRLASEGELMRLRTTPPGLVAGSEVAIPALLGWVPTGPVDRGAVEAAAHGISVGPGERAWRVDVVGAGLTQRADGSTAARAARADGSTVARAARADGSTVARAARALAAAAPGHAVHRLAGHRLLVCGPPPLPAAASAPGLRAWPEGIVPPRMLDEDTVLVGAAGAAVGVARLIGARTVIPHGATGLPDSDLAAKAAAAHAALEAGARVVIVHVGGPDEASHMRDRAAKIAALERADRDLIAPLAAAMRAAGGALRVGPDHGCDPETGAHDDAPVPWVAWWGGADPVSGRRLTERAVAGMAPRPVADGPTPRLLAPARHGTGTLARGDHRVAARSEIPVAHNSNYVRDMCHAPPPELLVSERGPGVGLPGSPAA
jgi:hypothetical protein